MKVVLLEPLRVSDAYIEELATGITDLGHEFEYFNEMTTDPEELLRRSKDADIIIIGNNPYPAEVIEGLDHAKLIDVAFTGVDHVDRKAADAKGIKIANASGYANQAVAELAIGLVLDLYRHISQGNQDIRQAEEFPGVIQGRQISGKTVGIVGTGNIGIETAKLFKAFGAKLIGYNRSENEEAKALGLEYRSLEDLMKESDIVSLHLPLTDETRGLIDKDLLHLMKEDAVLVNLARGPIVNSEDLAQALNEEVLAGAGLDVFDEEPPLSASEPLLQAKNTILTPHVGFLTDEAMEIRAQIAFDNAINFLQGKETNIVD